MTIGCLYIMQELESSNRKLRGGHAVESVGTRIY